MKPVENEIKKPERQNPESVFHQSAFSTTQPLWNSAESEKVPFLNAFFFSTGSFLFVGMCGGVFFFEILGKWSKFLRWKRGYCCVLSDFLILYTTAATSSLSVYSHHLQRASFCRFHPAASLFISATFALTSPSVFSLLLFYVRPPPHRWSLVFHAVPLLCVQLF